MKKFRLVRLGAIRALNYLLYLLGCFIAGTGLALEYRLPAGQGRGHHLAMLGMDRHEWGELHFYVGLCLAILVGVHLFLHRGWIMKAVKSVRGLLGWVGFVFGLVLLALPLLLPVAN